MGDVRISPPYQPDNCIGKSDEAVDRLKMMVSRLELSYKMPLNLGPWPGPTYS